MGYNKRISQDIIKENITNCKFDLQFERWISNFEGMYSVTINGEVYSFRYGIRRLLSNYSGKKGYYRVQLSYYGKSYKPLVHRLVAGAFIPNPEDKPEVNHKDGDKGNNFVENLEWVTSLENYLHAYHILGHIKGPQLGKFGREHNRAKTVYQYTTTNKLVKIWGAFSEISINHIDNINKGNICQVCKGKRKTAYGYKWSYIKLS